MKKGFTLLELLATIAIMAVLIAAVLPFVSNYTSWAKKVQAQRSALIIADAINRYNSLAPVGKTPQNLLTGGEGRAAVSAALMASAHIVTIDDSPSKFIAKDIATDVVITKGKVEVPTGVAGDTTRTASF